jgi:cytochrome c biogenesis protein CcmG, thiol:disulfide interchange protein DsbE
VGIWPNLLVKYGQSAALILVLLGVLSLIAILRKGRYFLLRGVLGWTVSVLASVVIYEAIAFLRWTSPIVTPLKPFFQQANQTAPDFEFQLLPDGTSQMLSRYRGKVVVLNLWATWCPICIDEMPTLDRLQRQYEKDGLVVVTVSDESATQMAKYAPLEQMSFVKARVNTASPDAKWYIGKGIARPITHVVDRNGILRETLVGGQDYNRFQDVIKPYL